MEMRIVCLLFLLLISLGIDAQQPSGRPLAIAELVSIALENNPQTKISWSYAQKMAAALGIAESGYYPHLGIDAYASHGRKFKYVNGPDVSYTNVGADLVLCMMLCDFGRTDAAVREAEYALLAANWQTDWALQKVMVKVLENAYSTAHAQEVLNAHLETLEDAENMLLTSKELNRTGLKAITDVYTGQSTLSQVRIEVSQQKALLDIQRGKLASSLGLPADAAIELAPLSALEAIHPQDVHSLIVRAKERRADLSAQQARKAESLERMNKTNAEFWPKLSLRARGGSDYYLHDKANPGHYDITVNVDIPLFKGFETVYKNRYTCAEAELAEGELAQMELDIALEVLTHARNLEAALEMLSYSRDLVENASMAYEGVMEKYKAGKEGIAELSIALRQLATARIRQSEIRTRYLVSMANLAYATGVLSPGMVR